MKKTISEYLTETHPKSNLNSINGKYNIRFELGGETLQNGTIERLNQVVNRANEIFKQSLGYKDIIIAIEEYENEFYDSKSKNKPYLFELISLNKLNKFKGPFEQTYYEFDELGNKSEHIAEDEIYCDLYIGNLVLNKETVSKIITGRANLEMGFEPAIPQDIYFYSTTNKTGFRIYDDRGCDIWSDDKEVLRPIYESLNDWILDYDRPEIDKYFK